MACNDEAAWTENTRKHVHTHTHTHFARSGACGLKYAQSCPCIHHHTWSIKDSMGTVIYFLVGFEREQKQGKTKETVVARIVRRD